MLKVRFRYLSFVIGYSSFVIGHSLLVEDKGDKGQRNLTDGFIFSDWIEIPFETGDLIS